MKCNTIEELERFWAIQEQALGKGSPEVATTVQKIACLCLARGESKRAETLYLAALDILQNASGLHQQEIDEITKALAHIRDDRERLCRTSVRRSTVNSIPGLKVITAGACASEVDDSVKTATQLLADAIRDMELDVMLLRQTVGAYHPAVAESLTQLADLNCRAKRYAPMEPLLLEALHIKQKAFGNMHPNIATELKNLAQLYVVLEKYAMAEPLLRQALAIREKHLGSGHPKVIDVKEQYAKLLKKTNRLAQACDLERQVNSSRQSNSNNNEGPAFPNAKMSHGTSP